MPPGASTLPATGSSSPAAVRSSVLLPAPLRPISATRSPALDLEVDPSQHVVRLVSAVELDPQVPRRQGVGGRRRPSHALRAASRRERRFARVACGRGPRPVATARVGEDLAGLADADRQRLDARRGRRGAPPGSPAPGRRRSPRRGTSRGAPSKAIAPASIATTRSAAARQRSRRCSARRTATPHSSLRRRSSQISSSPATGSSWEVGSSSRTSGGRVTSAAASATRCSSPPESVSTVRSSRCGIASASATSSTARARAAGGARRAAPAAARSRPRPWSRRPGSPGSWAT